MSISATASVSLSGIRANFDALQISADNVARHEVPNSEKNRAVYITIAKGGVALTPQVIPMEDTQKTTTTDTYTASNIDYAEEQTNQKITTVSAKANIRVFNISNEMEKALLNIKVQEKLPNQPKTCSQLSIHKILVDFFSENNSQQEGKDFL